MNLKKYILITFAIMSKFLEMVYHYAYGILFRVRIARSLIGSKKMHKEEKNNKIGPIERLHLMAPIAAF